MIENVIKTINKYRMLKPGQTVLAGVSGGVDSMVMLHLLNELRARLSLGIVVCHLNHNLRGNESRKDLEFVRKASAKLGFRFEGATLKKGELGLSGVSLQEAARIRRYEFFERCARKYKADRIALGHTIDDQAETVLMRMIKGSGLAGISGIPAVRGRFIRPLIGVKREELESFARKNNILHVSDSSNLSSKYLRNDVRLKLIPFIKRNYNPNIQDTLARTASVLSRDNEYMENEAERAFEGIMAHSGKEALTLSRGRLLELHSALAARVFLKALRVLRNEPDISSAHIESFFKLVEERKPNASIRLPGFVISREYENIVISVNKGPRPRKAKKNVKFFGLLNIPGLTDIMGSELIFKASLLKRPPARLSADDGCAYFNFDDIDGPIHIRPMNPGDRLVPIGMKGRKKIKDLFIDKKVPRSQRETIPLLCAGDIILWVPRVKRSDHYKVEKNTRKILKIVCMRRNAASTIRP